MSHRYPTRSKGPISNPTSLSSEASKKLQDSRETRQPVQSTSSTVLKCTVALCVLGLGVYAAWRSLQISDNETYEVNPAPDSSDIQDGDSVLSCTVNEQGAHCIRAIVEHAAGVAEQLSGSLNLMPGSGVNFEPHQWEALEGVSQVYDSSPGSRIPILNTPRS